MELLKAIILGLIQGLTEFLPVSSSGHLVIGSELLNFQEQGVVFDVFLHLGTLVAVVVVFREEIWAMVKAPLVLLVGKGDAVVRHYFRWDLYVVLATLPAVFVGAFFQRCCGTTFWQYFSCLLYADRDRTTHACGKISSPAR